MEKKRNKTKYEVVIEIFGETRAEVMVNDVGTGTFCQVGGVRKGCLLSPLLFAIFTADLKEELKKGNTAGVKIGKECVCSLACTEDLIMLAKKKQGCSGKANGVDQTLVGI